MALAPALKRYGYAPDRMPKAKRGDGPWGEAISYWLEINNQTQADLIRLLNAPAFVKTYGKPVTAKTVSRIVRGFDTQTRLLKRIAAALGKPLDLILVAPGRTLANEQRLQLARQAAEEVLRLSDAFGRAPGVPATVHELWDRLQRLSPDQQARVREVMEALDPARAPSERRPVPPKAVVPKTSRRK